MTLTPANRDELARALQSTSREGLPAPRLDLKCLNRICRYAPEDLTVTVEAGLTLGELQAVLGRHGQWLPMDPPGADALTLAEILDLDLSGPRRYGHGTIREHLIGLRVALADGRIVRSGGEVVKNVAGYDMMKLFVGAHGSLGVMVEAAFKLMPRPAREAFVAMGCPTWDDAARAIARVQDCAITPVVLDLHNVRPSAGRVATLVVGFAGTDEEVEWQLSEARNLGVTEPASLVYAGELRLGHDGTRKASVLPSRLVESLRELSPSLFIARAGNGVFYHRDAGLAAPKAGPIEFMRRVKDTFDPARIFPEVPVS